MSSDRTDANRAVAPTEIERAKRFIARGSVVWFDYCAYYGHIPGNVAHMPTIHEAFALWLRGEVTDGR